LQNLAVDSPLEKLRIDSTTLTQSDLKLIGDIVKIKKSLILINIFTEKIDSDTSIYMINALKSNNTLKYIGILLNYEDNNVCAYLAEFLKDNRSTYISFYGRDFVNLDGCNLVVNALEYNPYITAFYGLHIECYNTVKMYIERNKHNIKLKSMMLLDWS
jgi:hypothetical protein